MFQRKLPPRHYELFHPDNFLALSLLELRKIKTKLRNGHVIFRRNHYRQYCASGNPPGPRRLATIIIGKFNRHAVVGNGVISSGKRASLDQQNLLYIFTRGTQRSYASPAVRLGARKPRQNE